jgi:DNA-binding NarL/FixJ family response regulator
VKPTRILLADDHEIVRRGLQAVLETNPAFEIVGEAVDGQDTIEKAARLKPDVVVLDISMPRIDGFDAVRRIVRQKPDIKVLVLAAHESDTMATRALQAGAQGCILKSDSGREVLMAVESVRQGKPYFNLKVAEMVLRGFRQDNGVARNGNGSSGGQ